MKIKTLAVIALLPGIVLAQEATGDIFETAGAPQAIVEVAAEPMELPLPEVVSPEVTAQEVPVAPVEAVTIKDLTPELDALKAELAERDAVIERLSSHLESALKRLNSQKGVTSGDLPVKVSTALAAKDAAEREATFLRQKNDELSKEMESLSKKAQLLDLENRQLFQALNATPRTRGAYVAEQKPQPVKPITRHP